MPAIGRPLCSVISNWAVFIHLILCTFGISCKASNFRILRANCYLVSPVALRRGFPSDGQACFPVGFWYSGTLCLIKGSVIIIFWRLYHQGAFLYTERQQIADPMRSLKFLRAWEIYSLGGWSQLRIRAQFCSHAFPGLVRFSRHEQNFFTCLLFLFSNRSRLGLQLSLVQNSLNTAGFR